MADGGEEDGYFEDGDYNEDPDEDDAYFVDEDPGEEEAYFEDEDYNEDLGDEEEHYEDPVVNVDNPKGNAMIEDALFEMLYCGKQVKTVKPLPNNKPVENWPHVTYLLLDVQEHTDTGEGPGEGSQIFTKLYKNETSGVHVEHVLYNDKEQVYEEIRKQYKGIALTIRLIMNYSPCNEDEDGKKCCDKLRELFKYMTDRFKKNGRKVKYVVEFTQLYHVNKCSLLKIKDNKNGLRNLNNIQDQDVELGTINWPNLNNAITPYIPGIEELLESDEPLYFLRRLYNDILYKILFLNGTKPGKKMKVFRKMMEVKVTSLDEDQLKNYRTKHTKQGEGLEDILDTDS